MTESTQTCAYDGEPIEYGDPVVVTRMVQAHIVNQQVTFFDLKSDDEDYYYEPVFFALQNWEEIEEHFKVYVRDHPPVNVPGAILGCEYCKSGILPGETLAVVTGGEIERSARSPNGEAGSDHYLNDDPSPTIICISCMMELNEEFHTYWEDGVTNGEECRDGTLERCWRRGCPGNCPKKSE